MASNSYKKVIALGLDYSEFQGGIKDCTEEMKKLDSEYKALSTGMEKSATESEKLAANNEYLTKKIELQNRKVELASAKLKELAESEGATEAQIRKATIAVNNETAELNRLKNASIDAAIEQSNLKENTAMLAAVLAAVGAAAIECVKSVADYADELSTLSMQTGVSVEALQGWDYASDLIDTDFTAMTSSLQKLTKAMSTSPDAFRELGVSITDASGNLRDAESVFYETIDALRGISNETEQDQKAMEIFGKSAAELSGVIKAGSSGLRNYTNEAMALGQVLSTEEVEAAAKAKDSFDKLTNALDAAKMKIGVQLAPLFEKIAAVIAQIPAPVLAAAAAVAALTAAFVVGLATIASVVKSFQAISSVVGLATAAMNPNLVIVLAIVAALAMLAIAITQLIKLYREWRMEQEALNRATEKLGDHLSFGGLNHNGGGHSRGGSDHKATGGVSDGGMTWVGENGPELVDLPAGARVYNNHESKQIANSPTYNINMNVDISKLRSVSDVVDAVKGLGLSAGLGGSV